MTTSIERARFWLNSMSNDIAMCPWVHAYNKGKDIVFEDIFV